MIYFENLVMTMKRAIIILMFFILSGCLNANHQDKKHEPTMVGYIRDCGTSWLCPDSKECKEMKETNNTDYDIFCVPLWD